MAERVRVEELLERMGHAAVPADDDPRDDVRARSVAAMNARLDVLAERKLRSRRARRAVFAAIAATLALGLLAVAMWAPDRFAPRATAPRPSVRALEGDVEIVHAGEPVRTATAEPSDFEPADEIHTTAGARASAELPSGAKVSVAPMSLVRLSAAAKGKEELGLTRGQVEISVPHLLAGATLSVRTPDARVSVRGTHFVVEVVPRGAVSVTSVSVLEGSVWVETHGQKLVLERGARWSSAYEHSMPSSATSSGARDRAPPAAQGTTTVPLPRTSATAPRGAEQEAPSTLAVENELYLDAMKAARSGNESVAAERLGALLDRYPRSPLAPNARAERFRALARAGRSAEAAAEAERYLAAYPGGSARDEATELVKKADKTPP